jgi:hypothetical protein
LEQEVRKSIIPLIVSFAILVPVSLSTASGAPADASAIGTAARARPVPYVVAAGDIACGDPELDYEPDHDQFVRTRDLCHEDVTAAMFAPGGRLAGPGLQAVLPLGDLQYEYGGWREGFEGEFTYENPDCSIVPGFEAGPCSFHDSWAKAVAVWSDYGLRPPPLLPTPGNHEYQEREGNCRLAGVEPDGDPFSACGYNSYFGNRVAAPSQANGGDGRGSYTFGFNANSPHPILFVSLNTGQCDKGAGACEGDSRVIRYLQRVLSSPELNPPEACTVVYYHHPAWDRFLHGNLDYILPVWEAMFDPELKASQRPDLVLNGHNHLYTRYEPLDARGRVGTGRPAIPQITVGTGGKNAGWQPGDLPEDHAGRPAAKDLDHFGVEKVSWSAQEGTIEAAFYREGFPEPFDPVTYRCHGASL